MTRVTSDNSSGRWYSPRAWLPWTAFRTLALPWRAHAAATRAMTRQEARHNALLVVAVLLSLGTVACAVALPALELPISLVGALLVTALVIVGSGRAGEARTTLGELRLTLEESRDPQGAPHVALVRTWLLDVLLDWQARRSSARRGGVLQKGDHDHDRELDDGSAATPTGGRAVGIYRPRDQGRYPGPRDAGPQSSRGRGLGDGQLLSRQPGRGMARRRHHDRHCLHVQTPTSLTIPATPAADPTPAQCRGEEVSRG